MNRSHNGCWTCRIRHRKCDEVAPACRECSTRGLTCHGYGPRPRWVDDRALLEAEMRRIKVVVKSNFRKSRKIQLAQRGFTTKLGQRNGGDEGKTGTSASPIEQTSSKEDKSSRERTSSGRDSTSEEVHRREDMSFREAQLLVHYLDYIFPLQYPYYRDQPSLGGRGWLFWLLMKKGPLHQAVLTLSALHQHKQATAVPPSSSLASLPSTSSATTTEEELLGYHTMALHRLRLVLARCEVEDVGSSGNDSSEENRRLESRERMVELLACGSNLISFELFQGGVTNWQPHVDALASIVNKMLPPPPLSKRSSDGTHDDDLSTSPLSWSTARGLDVAEKFLIVKTVWVDLLGATSTGTAPQTLYRRWLAVEGVDMSSVMGCRNWAMGAVGDLAAIHGERREKMLEGRLGEMREIERKLINGVDDLRRELERLPPSAAGSSTTASITLVFAQAALVYLHSIIPDTEAHSPSGGISSSTFTAVEQTVEALERIPEGVSIRGLAWPMTVAGSMAEPDQQGFFEETLLRVLGSSEANFTNCDTVLRLLRECWRRRREDGTAQRGRATWRDGMAEMGICALLV